MSNLPNSESSEDTQSFRDLLTQYEQTHAHKTEGAKQLQATVVTVSADSVFLDIGYKIEGVLPLSASRTTAEAVEARRQVSGVHQRAATKTATTSFRLSASSGQPTGPRCRKPSPRNPTIVGTVTALVKGGFSVDVGVRAFMPASRSGARDAAEMEKLVGQEIPAASPSSTPPKKTSSSTAALSRKKQALAAQADRYCRAQRRRNRHAARSAASPTYGAFVDLGGIDGLLHVSDICLEPRQQSRRRPLRRPADRSQGPQDRRRQRKRISLGLKQLQPHPWDTAPESTQSAERIRGTVSRLTDFGAFVELEPGIEGLIHVSEMSWARKCKPSDVVKQGDTVDAVILSVSPAERRIGLGLKQALGDPWAEVAQKFPVGSAIEGPVTSITKFGAFVQLAEGVEGMVHVSEISAEKRINHPRDVLKPGEMVKAQVLAIDPEKRHISSA